MPRKRIIDNKEYVKPFPTNLRNLLKERKLKQDDLAKEVGIARQTIGYYANGSSKPDYETMKKIANYFGVTIDWLSGVDGATRSFNQSVESVCRFTGLSEKTVNFLNDIKGCENYIELINNVIQNIENFNKKQKENTK